MNSEPLPTSKMEFFVMIVNSIEKSPISDVAGVSGYKIVIIRFQPENCFYCSLGKTKLIYWSMGPINPILSKTKTIILQNFDQLAFI